MILRIEVPDSQLKLLDRMQTELETNTNRNLLVRSLKQMSNEDKKMTGEMILKGFLIEGNDIKAGSFCAPSPIGGYLALKYREAESAIKIVKGHWDVDKPVQ